MDWHFLKSKWNRFAIVGFFLIAGINHFWHPDFYLPLIPDYLPFHHFLNYISGFLELAGGILFAFKKTRLFAARALVALLILLVPSHIDFIVQGACILDSLCTTLWVAWLRLLLVQPLFILWIWASK